MNSIYSTLLAS